MCWCNPSIRTPCCGKLECIPTVNSQPQKLLDLRVKALADRMQAEKSMYAYACECDIGEERVAAFEAYERIRTATRRDF
jgi:hypothetical protein